MEAHTPRQRSLCQCKYMGGKCGHSVGLSGLCEHRSSAGAERSSISSNAARSSTVGTRPRGILPGADYECVRYTGIPYPSGNHLLTRPLSAGVGPDVSRSGTFGAQDQQLRTPPRSKGARGAAQAGVPGSPLDDLLICVRATHARSGCMRSGQVP
eukprot:1137637-Pelagomonas_calceolata.AAC.4